MTHRFPLTLLVLTALLAGGPPPVSAADEVNVGPGLTYAGAPLALQGFDPVALVDLGAQLPGEARHTATHEGLAYYLGSPENLAKFQAEPAKYTPQYGGFCAFGVSVGKKFDGDPRFAAVENGKLYVFLNEDILRAYQKDRTKTLVKAAKTWPKIQSVAARDL